jgi:hypothetical protein
MLTETEQRGTAEILDESQVQVHVDTDRAGGPAIERHQSERDREN